MNLLDSTFSPDNFSSRVYDLEFEKTFKWDKIISNINDMIVVTDNYICNCDMYPNKIGWLIESAEVSPFIYKTINHKSLNQILTHKKDLIELNPNKYKFVSVGGCWIKTSDQKIYDKTKLINIIASSKNWTSGHILRHQIIREVGDKIDVMGGLYKHLNYKLDGLKDYMFQIVVENSKYDYYYTEKIIDCFRTGVIPIYWGCPSIGEFFNEKGILVFNNIDELKKIISGLSFNKYASMIEYVYDNYDRSREYLLSEEYMVNKKLIKI